MHRIILVAALAALVGSALGQSKPQLNMNFQSVVESQSTFGNTTRKASSTISIDSKGYRLAVDQLAQPFDKQITQIMDFGKIKTQGGMSVVPVDLVEPFFKETICYAETAPVGPANMTAAQAFEAQQNVVPKGYDTAKYSGSATVRGIKVLLFTDKRQQVNHVRLAQEDGSVLAKANAINITTTFAVTAKGQIVQAKMVVSVSPTQRAVSTADYTKWVSPAPASAFNPPKVQCVKVGSTEGPRRPVDAIFLNPLLAQPLNQQDYIDQLNSEELTWTAGYNSYSAGMTMLDASARMGTMMGSLELPLREPHTMADSAIPSSFDSRKQWSKCKSIGTIRNQGACGSCWAFAATESLEDRVCIGTGKAAPQLSPEYIVSCDAHDGGCGGGFLDNAWTFLQKTGLVAETCDPYIHCAYPEFANCTKGSTPPPQPPTPPADVCPTQCKDGSKLGALFKAKSAYAVGKPGDVAAMQKEIMTHGPIEVAFFVFSDFMQYKGGVYSKSATAMGPLGGHAVRILGWGEDAGVPYWLVANSWSPTWGENGYFRIKRGSNECGIETTPAAGLAA